MKQLHESQGRQPRAAPTTKMAWLWNVLPEIHGNWKSYCPLVSVVYVTSAVQCVLTFGCFFCEQRERTLTRQKALASRISGGVLSVCHLGCCVFIDCPFHYEQERFLEDAWETTPTHGNLTTCSVRWRTLFGTWGTSFSIRVFILSRFTAVECGSRKTTEKLSDQQIGVTAVTACARVLLKTTPI